MAQPSLKPSFYLEEELKRHATTIPQTFLKLEEELKRHATPIPETLLLLRGEIGKTCHNHP